jgi:pyruvyl transferase EpsO
LTSRALQHIDEQQGSIRTSCCLSGTNRTMHWPSATASARRGGPSTPRSCSTSDLRRDRSQATAKRVVSAGAVLITDRLHAHILAVLLGWPHVYLDNCYSKIDRFASAWGTRSPIARRAESEAEAIAIAGELLEALTRPPADRSTGPRESS